MGQRHQLQATAGLTARRLAASLSSHRRRSGDRPSASALTIPASTACHTAADAGNSQQCLSSRPNARRRRSRPPWKARRRREQQCHPVFLVPCPTGSVITAPRREQILIREGRIGEGTGHRSSSRVEGRSLVATGESPDARSSSWRHPLLNLEFISVGKHGAAQNCSRTTVGRLSCLLITASQSVSNYRPEEGDTLTDRIGMADRRPCLAAAVVRRVFLGQRSPSYKACTLPAVWTHGGARLLAPADRLRRRRRCHLCSEEVGWAAC
uniref:Uncharacterized protein n=1 Tax=Oryza punctata TaxID=4537 RepID=A0A0E0M3T7_ORYPU